MTQPLQPLTQQLTERLVSPFGLAIVTAMASSSFWFFGSLELALDGIFPATSTEAERARKGISDAAALKLWEWAFPRAKKRFAPTILLSSASYLVASAFRPDLRPLLYSASLLSFSLAPYTFIFMLPINRNILQVADKASRLGEKGIEPGIVDKLFREWRNYHIVRISIAGVVWGLGTAALLLA